MTAKVICMASAKGGAGKTMLSASFGEFLAIALKKKVLLIDTDAATNGLTLLYLPEMVAQAELAKSQGRVPRGVYESIITASQVEVIKLSNGVYLIPSTYHFQNTETIDEKKYAESLKIIVDHFRQSYDYIFVDAQAGSDNHAREAIKTTISDEVIIISEYDALSVAGVERLKTLFIDELKFERTWILINRILPRLVPSFSSFLKVVRYLSPVPFYSDAAESYVERKIALDFNNGNEYSIAIMRTLMSLLGNEVANEIKQWADEQAYIFRQPVEKQYEMYEQELKKVIIDRKKTDIKKAKIDFLLQMSFLMFVSVMTMSGLENFNIFHISEIIKMLGILPAMTVLTLFVIFVVQKKFRLIERRAEEKIDELRRERREDYLKEKLSKLEALKDADFETLMRNRGK